MSDNTVESIKGKAKEVFAKATGNHRMHEEGKAQQKKAHAREKADEAAARQDALD